MLAVYIVDGAKRADSINVTLSRVTSIIGPFHDAHEFFGLFPLKNHGNNIQYELFLKRSLLHSFKPHDQIVLAITADDGKYTTKNEMYGIIEEARDPSLSTVRTMIILRLMIVLVIQLLIMEDPPGCDPLDPPSHPARSCARHRRQDNHTQRTNQHGQQVSCAI